MLDEARGFACAQTWLLWLLKNPHPGEVRLIHEQHYGGKVGLLRTLVHKPMQNWFR